MNNLLKDRLRSKVGGYWSRVQPTRSADGKAKRLRWWQSPYIVKDINRRVLGRAVPGVSQGLIELLKQEFSEQLPFKTAISVGCGNAFKEIHLLKSGLVDHFDLFELSEARIEQGVRRAEKFELSSRLQFHQQDAFEYATEANSYDLVHWNNSLHHMFDVDQAVSWSHSVLKPNGVFYMDDFVGPDRLQWSDTVLDLNSRIRMALSDHYLQSPFKDKKLVSQSMRRPNRRKLIAQDPSEAVQSSLIIDSVKKHFPDAKLIDTGGAVYTMALSDILDNFDDSDANDAMILDLLLIIDELASKLGDNYYAVALARKPQ